MEQWKTYEKVPIYEVSDEGNVRNSKTGRILKPAIGTDGRKQVQLSENGKSRTHRIGRMVAETFCDGYSDNRQSTYVNGDITNDRASNLEWSSKQEIIQRTFERGRKQYHIMKRVRHRETGVTYESIVECSKHTGVSARSISRSANGASMSTQEGYHFDFVD